MDLIFFDKSYVDLVKGQLGCCTKPPLSFDYYHGFVCGVSCCSELMEEFDYTGDILSTDSGVHDLWFEDVKNIEARRKLDQQINDGLLAGNYPLSELYPQIKAEFPQGLVEFCQGFMAAFAYTFSDWQQDFQLIANVEEFDSEMPIEEICKVIIGSVELIASGKKLKTEQGRNVKDISEYVDKVKNLEVGLISLYRLAVEIEQFKLGVVADELGEDFWTDGDDASFDDEIDDDEFADDQFWDDDNFIAEVDGDEYENHNVVPFVRDEVKVARNDPCPCGSGKKYKKCCYLTDSDKAKAINPASALNEEIKEAMQDKDFESIDEANEFLNNFMQQRNSQSIDVFHGLSSHKMHSLLTQPFEHNEVLLFNEQALLSVDTINNTQVMFLAMALIEGIGDKGVKATAKGNLPRNLCRAINTEFNATFGAPKYARTISKEEDFFDLHVVRVLLVLAKLVRVVKDKYIFTAPMKKLLKNPEQMPGKIYGLLFKTYCLEFNWAYRSYGEEFAFIQNSVGFSLYLLAKYGHSVKDGSWYAEEFLSAFPRLVDDIEFHSYVQDNQEEQIHRCYQHWLMNNFCEFFGLITVKRTKIDMFYELQEVRTTPLFNVFVKLIGSNPSSASCH
ncbi:SEC-C metal-binding domain-containing protein [Thalassotalea sp. ND16A]|uniref:SEC-C metal-binding domain-containing protein n=1 Tax=Thalassotalea sp. ND16A TaxID=1535422 RepID=UPI00051A064B|nr:SEC-C metal-binding domain-containing protein [Thalassotalea sp. ND16A]KGJ90463.1 hypothetical protein ND16A_1859 [Thalassotalea sp. ND16A]